MTMTMHFLVEFQKKKFPKGRNWIDDWDFRSFYKKNSCLFHFDTFLEFGRSRSSFPALFLHMETSLDSEESSLCRIFSSAKISY